MGKIILLGEYDEDGETEPTDELAQLKERITRLESTVDYLVGYLGVGDGY